jgi:hypothetical protein
MTRLIYSQSSGGIVRHFDKTFVFKALKSRNLFYSRIKYDKQDHQGKAASNEHSPQF